MLKKAVLLFVWAGILVAVIGFTWYQVSAIFKRSLAAPLIVELLASPTALVPPVSISTAVLVPSPTLQAKTCGQSGVMTILFLARDTANGDWPYGADLIRFVRLDFNNKTIRLIAVPRDLWVETPHLAALNLDHSRLGLVYFRVEQNTTGTAAQVATASTNAVAQAIYDNYGVAADHYIFFEMRYFAEAIDQLGGLDINIPAAISDSAATFSPGEQHLDGNRALYYARMLPAQELTEGWNRMGRQNLILKALIAKLLEPANILKIPGLIQQFREDYITDLSPELITDLACMADKVPQDQINNFQVEPAMIIGEGQDNAMLADTGMVSQFLQEQLAP